MSLDVIYLFEVFIIPITALLAPWLLAIIKWQKDGVKPSITKSQASKMFGLALLFSFFIFSALIFLTGGISSYFFLEEGLISISDREVAWNATRHLRILIPFSPGTSFLVIAVLSGIFYAGLLVLPPYCELPSFDSNSENRFKTKEVSSTIHGTTTTSATSSLFASVSALASGAVCCSTSVIALIAPAFGAFLAPFSPFLIVFSLLIIDVSSWRFLIPRIPTS